MTVFEFYEKYPTKDKKEKALSIMSEEEFRELIDSCGIVQAKIAYKELYTQAVKERDNYLHVFHSERFDYEEQE